MKTAFTARVALPLLAALLIGQSQAAPSEILIGSSLPITGPLSGFSVAQKWAFDNVIAAVNKAGGLQVGSQKLPVRLITYDDQSRPELSTQNTERLITRDGVVALMSGGTPPLAIGASVAAERGGVPIIVTAPIRSVLGASKTPWRWMHDIFFDELQMTDQQYLTMNTVASNKKVALFTDNEQDGVAMGGLWESKAAKFGYTIAYHAKFPVGTSDYGDLIRRAKAAGAEIVISQMLPPDVIALRKQMVSLNYSPKAMFFEKGGEPYEFVKAMGPLANGVLVAGYAHPSLKYPGAASLKTQFEKETGQSYAQITALAKTSMEVMLDAITAAGSLDPRAIDAAITKTNKTYVAGKVSFGADLGGRAAIMPIFMTQWQNGVAQIVFPKNLATAKLIYPIK